MVLVLSVPDWESVDMPRACQCDGTDNNTKDALVGYALSSQLASWA
jgi:hypothetical protein